MRIGPFFRTLLAFATLATPLLSQQPSCQPEWVDLLQPELKGWQKLGFGEWTLDDEGVVTGVRHEDLRQLQSLKPFDFQMVRGWVQTQSWLYTEREYENYDLSLEYWVRSPGNSGISIRDPKRAECGVKIPPDFSCTPSHSAYEIQINSDWPDKWASGSIYGLVQAEGVEQKRMDWNKMEIESRKDAIRVKINGKLVAEHPGAPGRALKGPIGLQLHDLTSFTRFRNIRIKEICQ